MLVGIYECDPIIRVSFWHFHSFILTKMGIVKVYRSYNQGNILGMIVGKHSPVLLAELPIQSDYIFLCIVAVLENVILWDIKLSTIHMILYGEKFVVTSFSLDNTGQYLAVGYSNGLIKLWDVFSQNCVVTFNGHNSAVKVLTFSSSGLQIASGGHDTDILIWDIVNESGLFRLTGHKSMITAIDFLGEHYLISTSIDGLVKIWDILFAFAFQTITDISSEVLTNLIIKDAFMIISTNDGRLRLFGNANDVKPLNFSISARQFDPNSKEQIPHNFRFIGFIERITKSPILKLFYMNFPSTIIAQSERTVECYSLPLIHEKFELPSSDFIPTPLNFHSEIYLSGVVFLKNVFYAKKIYTSDMKLNHFGHEIFVMNLGNNHIEIYKVDEHLEFLLLSSVSNFHHSSICCLSFSSDSQLLATGSSDKLCIWGTSNEQLLFSVSLMNCLACCFLPGNRYIIAGTKSGFVHSVDIHLSCVLQSFQLNSHAISSLIFHPLLDGITFCSPSTILNFSALHFTQNDNIVLEEQCCYELPEESLFMKYSPDGELLAVCLLDNTIIVFLVHTMKTMLRLYGHKLPVHSLDITHDSTILASGSADKSIKIWGLDFGNCLRSIISHSVAINCVVFIPNTHQLFSSGRDNVIKLVDIDTTDEILTLSGSQDCFLFLAVSSDGNLLSASSRDVSLRLWKRSSEQLFSTEIVNISDNDIKIFR